LVLANGACLKSSLHGNAREDPGMTFEPDDGKKKLKIDDEEAGRVRNKRRGLAAPSSMCLLISHKF
jgi:hypothetical protein